jgi:LysM repeat protein
MAGLAAAFALGNAPAATAATVDASGPHHSAATAATSQPGVSLALLMAITGQSAAGLPVIQLDASRWADIEPKGKHHRTLPAKYVVKPGDTLASIAKHLYFSSDYWTVLYWANHGQIKYANEINAGQVLSVPAKPSKVPSGPKALAASPAPTSYSSASTTTTTPAQTESSSTGTGTGTGSSFQACVIAAESGGNPQVMSSSGYYGLYQFSASTWAAYGGNPADFGHASVAEQNRVFDNAIAAGGASNWSQYDGC